MPVDLFAWRTVIQQVVDGIGDEALQRRAWFGPGPEISSPDEMFNQFFGDAAVAEFLDRNDNGLNNLQRQAGIRLTRLMRELSDQTPGHIEANQLIDDPRWQAIRTAAAKFLALIQSTERK
jgi:hypothetical protein